MIHGDLKGVRDSWIFLFTTALIPSQSNVLVDVTGHARITDFGIALVTQDLLSMRSAFSGRAQTTRWIAPEVLGDRETYSKEADVFSFAGVMIEVCCKRLVLGAKE